MYNSVCEFRTKELDKDVILSKKIKKVTSFVKNCSKRGVFLPFFVIFDKKLNFFYFFLCGKSFFVYLCSRISN